MIKMNTNFKQYSAYIWESVFGQTNSLHEFLDHRSVQIFANEIQKERKGMPLVQQELQVSILIKSKNEHTKGNNLIFATQLTSPGSGSRVWKFATWPLDD